MANARGMEPWTRELSPEVRRRLSALHEVDARRSAVRLLSYVGLWAVAALAACSTPSLWVRLPAWTVIAFCLHAFGDFLHMCGHRSVFGRPGLDRFVGFLCGLPIFVSCACYWAGHRLHHRWLGTDRDPDSMCRVAPHLRPLVVRLYALVGFPLYTLRLTALGPLWAASARERLLCLLETGAMGLLYTLLLRGGPHPLLVDGWLMALPLAMLVANVRGLAEHTLLPSGVVTRTTLTNPVLGFFFNNQNFHHEHHLLPSLPWHALPQAHALVGGGGGGVEVSRGYGRFVARLAGLSGSP